jgi:glycosyltransferase involved in cell wall biosynthesis
MRTAANTTREGVSGTSSRLLFLCAELDNGGAERHWAALIPALADLGVGVRVVAIKGGGRALEVLQSAGVPIRELGRSGLRSFAALPALLEERGSHPTAIVTFGYNSHAVGAVLSRLTGTPQIINWHRQQGWPMNVVERNAVRLAAKAGAGVIGVTEAQIDDLSGLGFPAGRIRVVNNGVKEPAMAELDRSLIRGRLGLDDAAFIAVLVARLRPEKRIVDFIDAVALAKRRLPALQGVVVGDGPMGEELERYAVDRAADVRFVGHQRDPAAWMVAGDVVCLTSNFEALPISLVEAISCGRACIATDVGGTREIVEDGVNGKLTKPEDPASVAASMVLLAEDPDLREAMGEASLRRWRDCFSFDTMVDRYAGLLGSVKGPPAEWAESIEGIGSTKPVLG